MRTNAGYQITHSYRIGNCEIVLGQWILTDTKEEYVTWYHNINNEGYYFGHYFTKRENAIKDFIERISYESQIDINILKASIEGVIEL